MIETDAGRKADGIGEGGTEPEGRAVPLTLLQVTECFRTVMDLLTAQQRASLAVRDLADSLPRNLLPEHQCTMEFLGNAIEKIDDVLTGVVEELEVLRATLGARPSDERSEVVGRTAAGK